MSKQIIILASLELDLKSRLVAIVSILLASTLFLSITIQEQIQKEESFAKLNDDTWVKARISESFPGFPVISYLGNTTSTDQEPFTGLASQMARIVVSELGWKPEYFRWFTVSQTAAHDPANHYHVGCIASDLIVYDFGFDVGFQ